MAMALAIATIVTSTLCFVTVAQHNCRSDVANLSPCYGYMQGREFFPSPDCCNRLEDVVDQRPDCLCEVVRGNRSINQTLFLQLPSTCGVRTPSVGNCYNENTPPYYSGTPPYFSGGASGLATDPAAAASPFSSPADGSIGPTDSPTVNNNVPSIPSSGSESKTVPTTNTRTSDGSSVVSSIRRLPALLFLLLWTINCVKF